MTTAGQESLFDHVRWVAQEDANGCAPATVAMLTGRTYLEARDIIDGLWDRGPKDWTTEGCSNYDIDRALFAHGYFTQRRYATYTEGSTARLNFPVPFAPVHYAMVEQPSGNHHFVVMLHDGTVLDGMREGRYALSDWSKVLQVVGVAAPLTAVHADVAKAANRYVNAQAEGHDGLIADSHTQLLRAVTNWRARV